MHKTAAIEICREDARKFANHLRVLHKDAAEISKFEAMTAAILTKGETLSDDFFAALPADPRQIMRAIHAA